MPQLLAWTVLISAATTVGLLLPLALHRVHLLLLARREPTEIEEWRGPLPHVTVQLPVFNEANVVGRLVDAAAALNHPRSLLDIQVLDDSTDETVERIAERVTFWRGRGVRIRHLRRAARDGFKAGALQQGLETAEGDFILVLDADFVPLPDLITRLLGPFQDPGVGMVQARWDHVNEGRSLLTRCQALLLDAHFFLEQGGRWAGGRFMSFNGTAGMWRREALEDAGGWSADTLTEDLDLSYRAQMTGWRFVFRPQVGVPAEIPETVRGLEVQQKRWSQGGVQTGRKVLPALLAGPWSPVIKWEAVAHLFGHVAHPLTLVLGVLLVPSALARQALGLEGLLVLDILVFLCATTSFLLFYCMAGRRRSRPWRSLLPVALLTMALGIGLTASVSRAVVRGLWKGAGDPFHRTPKRGDGGTWYSSPSGRGDLGLKLGLTVWMCASLVVAVTGELFATVPFVVLFGAGYAWLAVGELREALETRLRSGEEASARTARGREPLVAS